MTENKTLLASESMVSKVSKLLNQAERAPEGSPEREVFMEKAMALSAAYSIDLAIARAHQAKKERAEQPERRSFKVGQVGLSTNKNAHFVDLMLAICNANDIKVTISESNTFVFGTGMPSDLDMAERMFALLAPQMVAEADAQLKAGANKERRLEPKLKRVEIPEDERAWGQHNGSDNWDEGSYYDERDEDLRERNGKLYRSRFSNRTYCYEWVVAHPPPKFKNVPVTDDEGNPIFEEKLVSVSDARVWRVNFYQGFIQRTGQRLRQAKRQALREAGIDVASESDSRAVALRDKAKEVLEAFEENEKVVLSTGRTYSGAKVSSHDWSGQAAGDSAAQRARLGNEKDLGRS